MIFKEYYDSPIGVIAILSNEDGIIRVDFVNEQISDELANEFTSKCKIQLVEYFKGQRKNFTLKLAPKGTAFQEKVWEAISRVPFGTTRSYLEISAGLGGKNYCRAVGAAIGRNPISIIVPCHRIVGSDHSLTGYAWGIQRKTWLLEHERKYSEYIYRII